MDAVTPKTTSRWTRGTGQKPKIGARDIEVFKALHRYRYLPSDDIHALLQLTYPDADYEATRKRLKVLYWHGYLNRPHQQRENANANYSNLIYELDTAGGTILRQHGLPHLPKSYHRNFVHELMVSRIMCSLELGIAKDPKAQFISWQDIIANDHTPRKTREADAPHRIPVKDGESVADFFPHGIRRLSFMFFDGIEADCATEPITTSDYQRSSIAKKFENKLYILEHRIYETCLGFPVIYFPFYFPTEARKESAMALLERMTTHKPSLRKHFLFKTFPTLTTYGEQAPATGHVYTTPFARVQYPPFKLCEQ